MALCECRREADINSGRFTRGYGHGQGCRSGSEGHPPHDRHTVATLLLRYGADIRIVQEVLGHASIATTQRYTHVSKDHVLSALRARHPNHHQKISWSAQFAEG